MEKKAIFLLNFRFWAVVCLCVYGVLRYAAVWLLPFWIAWALAALCERAVDWCCRRMRLKRSFVAAVVTLTVTGAVTGLTAAGLVRLGREAARLSAELGDALTLMQGLTSRLTARLDSFCSACPEGMQQWMEQAAASLSRQLGMGGVELGRRLGALAAGAVAAAPRAALFIGTTVLALYFTAASYPQLRAWAASCVPKAWRGLGERMRRTAFLSVGKWLKAQGILLTVTFCELLAGLWLLGRPYPLLLAVVIAVVDALPVLGTGTVLIPWAVLLFAMGDIPGGLGLTALYAVVTVVRSVLTPKVMAGQGQVHPLAALAAMYGGFRLAGVGGMLLFPLALLFVQQLRLAGIFSEIRAFLRQDSVVKSCRME